MQIRSLGSRAFLLFSIVLMASVMSANAVKASNAKIVADVSRKSFPKLRPHFTILTQNGTKFMATQKPSTTSKAIERCPIDETHSGRNKTRISPLNSKLFCQIDMKAAIPSQMNTTALDKCPDVLDSRCIPASNYFIRQGNHACHIQCPNFFPNRSKCGPTIFIIGAMKAATTSLYGFLSTHPDFCPSDHKELHFYGPKAPSNKKQRIESYLKNFPSKRHCMSGEATPMYSITKSAALQIKEDWPNARIIFLMRNPSLRAKSHYDMALDRIARGDQKEGVKSFRKEMIANIETARKGLLHSENGTVNMHKLQDATHYAYVERGIYASQLEFWLQHFPSDQILVGSFEDMVNPKYQSCMLKTILRFVGLSTDNLPKNFEFVLPHRNAHSHSANVSIADIQALDNFYRPFNRRLNKLLGRETGYPA